MDNKISEHDSAVIKVLSQRSDGFSPIQIAYKLNRLKDDVERSIDRLKASGYVKDFPCYGRVCLVEFDTYTRIYKQTQKLATLLARLDGFDIAEGCEIDHKSKGRASGWWSGAVEIQEFMNGHEMADIIDEIEEAFPEKFPTIEIPSREQQLEKALQSVIDLQKANYGDGMDTHMAIKTLVDETLSPLLVKVGK